MNTTDTKSFINRFLGAAFALADSLERQDIASGDRIELHLTPAQIAVLRNGLTIGDWLTGEKAAQQEGKAAYAAFGPVAIYRAPPRPFVASELPPHQQRVVAEHAELRDKDVALAAFIKSPAFNSLPEGERALLNQQHYAMQAYRVILLRRMQAWGVQA